jgi:hypothetical protein
MTSLLNIAGNIPVSAAEEGQSLRFEDADSPYLSLTPSSAGNQDVWTFSAWVKRGNIGAIYPTIFAAGTTTTDRFLFRFSADKLDVFWRDANTTNRNLTTNALYRDCSAWYHVVLAVDTTDATTANRMRLYVNGDEVTSFSADNRSTLSSGSTLAVNDAVLHTIGTRAYSVGNYYDGYIANACFIDGQQLDPTSFGEYSDTLWKPKDVSGLTFGTNGFFLDFSDSSAIGDDTSGNNNDFTVSNLVATDVVLDGAYNGGNFATLNPIQSLYSNSVTTFSEGNLKAALGNASAWRSAVATQQHSSGKWYYEVYANQGTNGFIGFGHDNFDINSTAAYAGSTAGSWGWLVSGQLYNNNASIDTLSTYTTGDIISIALDFDNAKAYWAKNGTWENSADPAAGTGGTSIDADKLYKMGFSNVSGYTSTANFGQDSSFAGVATPQGNTDSNGVGDFYYAPPSGFLCLKTSSLPAATITAPDEYFNTVLWTGDATYPRSITGVNFQPDLIWVKSRNQAYHHLLQDSVRGTGSAGLYSSSTEAEGYYTANHNIASFDADGFTLNSTTGTDILNGSGVTNVAWNWLANGTGVSNTNGDLDSTVSANQTAGFSIVSFDLEATGSKTVGHGLSSPPEMIIVKARNTTVSTSNWFVYHSGIASDAETDYILLNELGGSIDSNILWDDTAPTSSVFTMGSVFTSGNFSTAQIAYCFHSVDGYSKIGSYTGDGDVDGVFVHCGFRPAFLMVKRTDAIGSSWIIIDSKRNPVNVVDANLFPNGTFQEDSTSGYLEADFLSNGFKLRSNHGAANDSGIVYIFYAVAEAPFKSANAR